MIEVRIAEEKQVDLAPDPTVPFRVIHDGKDFAVVEKPAGVVTHPSHTHKSGTLVNGLLARWPEIRGVGDPSTIRQAHGGELSRTTSSGQENLRPGIVHRLDKETSGLWWLPKLSQCLSG